MIAIPGNVRVWPATGHTDMRRGFPSLARLVQESLKRDPHASDLYVTISVAQLSYLLSGIDWRMPQATWRQLDRLVGRRAGSGLVSRHTAAVIEQLERVDCA